MATEMLSLTEQILNSAMINLNKGEVTLEDQTVIPIGRCECPECEVIYRSTVITDMGGRARYRMKCPHGHEWEYLP